jgi:hypothetical protein
MVAQNETTDGVLFKVCTRPTVSLGMEIMTAKRHHGQNKLHRLNTPKQEPRAGDLTPRPAIPTASCWRRPWPARTGNCDAGSASGPWRPRTRRASQPPEPSASSRGGGCCSSSPPARTRPGRTRPTPVGRWPPT